MRIGGHHMQTDVGQVVAMATKQRFWVGGA